jgi:hypothetical protein
MGPGALRCRSKFVSPAVNQTIATGPGEEEIAQMKGTYLWSKYQSLIGRKGKKKTLVAET